jgi:WD40 repeat protein
MRPFSFLALSVLIVLLGSASGHAQHKPEVIERCKKATALVEVATPEGEATGSGFCIDRSGLFITNAHVVGKAADSRGQVRLVLDIGQKAQRSRRAKVLRADDALDLALLKVDAEVGLSPLELGKDDALIETASVMSFGFPFGRKPTVRGEAYPDISVIPSRITALRRDKGRLEGIQFDGQLNPGNSGGPVVDEAGRVIGVAVATIRGAAMNLAIPVGRLSDFLKAPGLVFNPPPLAYKDRSRPVTWTIKVQPPMPQAKLPEKLTVEVKIVHDLDQPRTYKAQPLGDGVFKVNVTPVPRDPDRKVDLDVRFPNGQATQVQVKDGDVKVGNTKFMLSDLQFLFGGPSPRAHTNRGQLAFGPILGLGKVRKRVGTKTVTIDLNEASQITVRPLDPPRPVQAIEALVEAKQGTSVLASVLKRADLSGAPAPTAVAVRIGRNIVVVPTRPQPPMMSGPQGPSDEGLLKIGGVLDVDGVPCGSAKAIRPPSVAVGEARIGDAPPPAARSEVRRLLGHTNEVMDLVLSSDGRYLVSCDLDGIIRVWDPKSGAPIHTLRGHRGRVGVLAMSPDGRQVLSGGEDRVLRLWDIERGQLLREFRGHGDAIMAIAFTPDGRRCLSAGGERSHSQVGTDRDIWVRDLEDGRVIARWTGHTGIIDALAVSPDGKLALSSSSDQTARLWDIETGRELRRFPGQPELDLHAIFSPDGRRAVVTSAGHLVRVFDVETGLESLQLRGHTAKVDSLAVSPDGRLLVSGSWPERMFRIWDLTDGRALGQIALEGNPQLGTFTPDGRRIIWSFSDKTIREFALPDSLLSVRQPGVQGAGDPLIRMLEGKIHDLAVGGGGRYLILTLKDARKVAIFDVNAADIIKTITLPSENALVAAGAKAFFIAFPDQGLFQRWDLETMTRQGTSLPSPIRGRLKGLAMGSDSDGPLLAFWSPDSTQNIAEQVRFSFLDSKSLKVLRAGPITNGGFQGIGSVSPSGGSILLHPFFRERVHVRASASGDLYGIWQTNGSPSGFQTLAVHKARLKGIYNHDGLDHLAPGPDGLTVYTGRGGVLSAEGKPVKGPESRPPMLAELTVPSCDPAYYLSIDGLNGNGVPNSGPSLATLSVSVHAADDGNRFLTVRELDEMKSAGRNESSITDDFTVDKRFHLVPAAELLITIPFSNDRIVMRRLDITKALGQFGSENIIVTSRSVLNAQANRAIQHQIEGRSKAGGLRYSLAKGPDGLTVSPAGQLSWLPPKEQAGEVVTAVVTVADSAGRERFHTITIRVD